MEHDVTVISFSAQNEFQAASPIAGAISDEGAAGCFIAGPENQLAAKALGWLAENSDQSYSPLVLCGPSGTGKSHLSRDVAGARQGCVHTNATEFARELAAAIDGGTVAEFQSRHRTAEMLVFEDLSQLSAKRAASIEFQHTLDALEAREASVLITSRVPPAEIAALPAGLVSRLNGGLVVTLSPPALAARRAILRRLAISRGIQFDADALDLMAEKLNLTAPQLRGAIMELAAGFDAEDRNTSLVVDLDRAKRFLADRRPASRPELTEVSSAVAKYYGLKPAVLSGPSRRRQAVLARNVAMYLGRLLAGASLAALGRHFGGRDHTTALHGCRSIERRLPRDAELRAAVGRLERTLSAA